MRLFIAVNFFECVIDKILKIQEQLRIQCLKGNFSRKENFHLTLVFLGETPEERVKDICRIINEIKTDPFEIVFSRTGCFTHSRKELWWIGTAPQCPGLPLLESMHTQLLENLLGAGLSADSRPFNAHITLGREIKHSTPIILDPPKINVKVDRISLMKSWQVSGRLTYTEIYGKDLYK